ncbi:hypothetical protein D9M68_496780 [compost metagenome]
MAPWVRPGYMAQEVFAALTISASIRPMECGRPWPPYTGSADRPFQPPSTYCAKASLKPLGVVTTPSFHTAPSSSPERFNGASTCSQNLAPSSRMALTMSGVASVAPIAA